MIYISTACVKKDTIKESVEELAINGFENIELSGGTKHYDHNHIVEELLLLKQKYSLNYLLHNYFPPPKDDFVLNLASLDVDINKLSFNHIINSIDISKKLGAKYYGFHAGFYLDIPTNEIGKKLSIRPYNQKSQKKAEKIFYNNYKKIKDYATLKGITIFVENNVYSLENHKTFGDANPLMLLKKDDLISIEKQININLLLDYAHLKVSCNTFKLDFDQDCDYLLSKSKYIHLSDNDGTKDSNNVILEKSNMFQLLKRQDLTDKTITLEMYESMEAIKKSYKLIESLI